MANIDAQIAWEKLDQPTFDRFVEALLIRWHNDISPQARIDAIDGRGGDGGVDLDVHLDEKLTHIYQLKYFPEGFSGQWGKSRKPQIKRSFIKAMQHHPQKWVLVVPGNPTQGERAFVKSLKKDTKVKIEIIGGSKLDNLMAQYTDIQRWALHEPVLDALKSIHLERSLLLQPYDLENSIKPIYDMANARSPHWRVEFSFSNGEFTETLVPKHPQAQEKEPIGLRKATISIPWEEEDLVQRAERVLQYGDNEELILDSDHLEEVEIQAPAWSRLANFPQVSQLSLTTPDRAHKTASIEFEILDEEDTIVRSYTGSTTYFGRGSEGFTLRASIRGGIILAMYLPQPEKNDGGKSSVSITQAPVGIPASEAELGARFMRDMHSGMHVRTILNGMFAHSFLSDTEMPEENADDSRRYTRSLIEDLAVLERNLGVTFLVPDSVSQRERMEIRIARLLLEGKVIIHPFIDTFNGQLSPDADPETLQMLASGAVSFLVDQGDHKMEILGRKVSLGPARFYLSHGLVHDVPGLAEAITHRGSDAQPIKIQAAQGAGIKVLLSSKMQTTESQLAVTPWGLPGISEHHELRGTTPPPSVSLQNSRPEERAYGDDKQGFRNTTGNVS